MRQLSLASTLCLFLLPGAALADPMVIQMYDRSDYKGSLALTIAGIPPCTFQLRGQDKDRDVCTLDLPKDAGTLNLKGDFAWKHYLRGHQKVKGTQSLKIVDLAPMVGILRDGQKPFGQRLLDFKAAKAAFEKRHEDLADQAYFVFGLGTPAKLEAVKAAEKRLGFSLPPEHASLLLKAGQMDVGDSSTTQAEELKNAYDAMIQDWETPRESMQEDLSPKTAELFKNSALLFTEVGDGLGALLYRPAKDPKAGPCNGQPAYYWVHQDSIDEPSLLKNRDGKCKTYSEAMIWVLAQLGLSGYDDDGLGFVLVDRSAPGPWRLKLHHDVDFHFAFELPWEEFE